MEQLKFLPNLITLGNLFLGCIGIYLTFNDQAPLGGLFLFGAALLDFLDGFVARWLNAASPIGKQLDSLADVVSFGVLPGAIFFQMLAIATNANIHALESNNIFVWSGFLLPVFSAWRLARFNLDTNSAEEFSGLPTPAMGMFVASLPLIYYFNPYGMNTLTVNPWILFPMLVVLCWIMVSKLPLMALKFKTLGWTGNEVRYVFLFISLVLIIGLRYAAVPPVIILYVLFSLFNKKTAQ